MRHKAMFILVAIALIFSLGIRHSFCAEEDTAKIISKLDEVLANQAKIFKEFNDIKQELNVIKLRATR